VVLVAVALPIFDRGDRSADCAEFRRRDNSGLFLRVALDTSARRYDNLDASVVNEATAHTEIDRRLGACRFVSRRDCRGVSTHRMHHSGESHGGMSLLDCANAKASSESQSRADNVCLVFSSLLRPEASLKVLSDPCTRRAPKKELPRPMEVSQVSMTKLLCDDKKWISCRNEVWYALERVVALVKLIASDDYDAVSETTFRPALGHYQALGVSVGVLREEWPWDLAVQIWQFNFTILLY